MRKINNPLQIEANDKYTKLPEKEIQVACKSTEGCLTTLTEREMQTTQYHLLCFRLSKILKSDNTLYGGKGMHGL